MDLQMLRLNTVLKLQTLNLEKPELQRVCNRVMRGNTKSVKKVIYHYIRNHPFRQTSEYFREFIYKKNYKFIKKLSGEQVRKIVSHELETRLKHQFKRKIKTVAFQKIVDIAIDSTERSEAITRDGLIVRDFIPQWIQSNYKLIVGDEVELVDTDELYNHRILELNADSIKMKQDINELINHLDYINYLRKQKALKIKEPKQLTGLVRMEDYVNYLKELREYRDYEQELKDYIKIVERFLNESCLPPKLKRLIREHDYEVKDKDLTIQLKKIKDNFRRILLFEKYGKIKDKFWKGNKEVRNPAIVLDTLEENASLDLSQFLLNCIRVDKKNFQKFYNLLKIKSIRIISIGEVRNKIYFVYDYLAPKNWFKESFFRSVEEKLDEKDLEINEELEIDFDFPYFGYYSTQLKFTRNFMMFMNKSRLVGLSERKIKFGDKFLLATINPYQIYYPIRRKVSRRQIITREEKQKEYFKLYSCFHNKNIFRRHSYESGDERLDNFINEMELMSGNVVKCMKTGVKHYLDEFLNDVMENYPNAATKKDVISFLKDIKNKYAKRKLRAMRKIKKIETMKEELKKYHGNSKEAKKLKQLIKAIKFPNVDEIIKTYEKYGRMIKGVKRNCVGDEFKHFLYDFVDKFCDEKYYRRITIQRDIVSYAKCMANNLNIDGVVKIYQNKDKFLHKFYNEYEDYTDDLPGFTTINKRKIKISSLLKALMEVVIKSKSKVFDELFDLLYELELETKEKKLLDGFNLLI